MSQTYDPVPETTELRRVRITSPVRPPGMGSVLVLERTEGEPVVVRHGERVPEARTGNYRRMHRVNTTSHALRTTMEVPSSDPAFTFRVTLRFACQVIDPVAIARDGVRDMAAALLPSLFGIVQEVAAQYDVLNSNQAASAITERLNSAYPLSSVRLSSFTASATAVDSAAIVTTKQDLRVEEMRRTAMRPVVSGGRNEMLAHIMAKTDGDPTPLLDREQAAREAGTEASLTALRVLMGESKKIEDFSTAEIRKHAVERFLPGAKPLGAPGSGGIRKRLELKKNGELANGQVVEGNTPTGPEEPASSSEEPPPDNGNGNGNGNGHRLSRLRGTAKPSRPEQQ